MSKLLTPIIVVVIAIVAYTGNVLFSDNVRSTSGSYTHWITITSTAINDFPVLEPIEEPIYFYSSADGPSPSVQEIRYESAAEADAINREVSSHLRKLGYHSEAGMFVQGDEQIFIKTENLENNTIRISAALMTY